MAHTIEKIQIADTNHSTELASDGITGKRLVMNVYIGHHLDSYTSFNIYINNVYVDGSNDLNRAIDKYNQIEVKNDK